MTRWKASATHLCLSILIVGGIATAAFLLWYPYGLYKVAGLDRILLVMLGIDLTAGPLLTLILYRKGKRGLKFDLTVVAIAQIAFLGYGLHTLWGGRPVFLVGTPETFTLVFANEISDDDLSRAAKPAWRSLSWTGPVLVSTQLPKDPTQRQHVIEALMDGGAGIERSPKYYLDFEQVAPKLLKNARKIEVGDHINENDVHRTGLSREQLRWLPIVSRRGEGMALLDGGNGRLLQTLAAPSN